MIGRRLVAVAVACAAMCAPLVVAAPALAGGTSVTVSKTHTGSFVVGSTATFTIGLASGNGGTGSGHFTATDVLPTGLSFVSAGSGNSTWTCGASGQTVTCTGTPSIPSNSSSTFPIVVSVLPTAFPSVTNSVTITDNCGNGCYIYQNNPASDTANVVLATPPAYTKEPGEGTGFPTVLNTFQATGLAQSVSTTDGSKTVILDLPAGALAPTTQVTLYGGATAALQGHLPSGATYVDGYAVAWVLLGQTPAATSAITMTVKDPSVTASTVIYSTTGAALATTQATVTAGQYVVSFTADPGFVAAKPAGSSTVTPSVPATGSGMAAGLLGAALVAGCVGLITTALRRRRPV